MQVGAVSRAPTAAGCDGRRDARRVGPHAFDRITDSWHPVRMIPTADRQRRVNRRRPLGQNDLDVSMRNAACSERDHRHEPSIRTRHVDRSNDRLEQLTGRDAAPHRRRAYPRWRLPDSHHAVPAVLDRRVSGGKADRRRPTSERHDRRRGSHDRAAPAARPGGPRRLGDDAGGPHPDGGTAAGDDRAGDGVARRGAARAHRDIPPGGGAGAGALRASG